MQKDCSEHPCPVGRLYIAPICKGTKGGEVEQDKAPMGEAVPGEVH